MKKLIALILALAMGFSFTACDNQHQHTWVEATCEEPKHCQSCGATEGEPLLHTWEDATYTAPKTCSVCGATEGEPLPEPYFVKNNISFDTLGDLDLATVSGIEKNGAWSQDDDIWVETGPAHYTFGAATCVPSEEIGYMDVMIPYNMTYSMTLYWDDTKRRDHPDEPYQPWVYWCSFDIGDYYTGKTIAGRSLVVSPEDSATDSTEYEWNGNTYSIKCSVSSEENEEASVYGDWTWDGDIAYETEQIAIDTILKITIPQGYDGTVLSIERDGLTEKPGAPGEILTGDNGCFLDEHGADYYYFYRLSDLVDLDNGEEYIYDVPDPGEDIELPAERLNLVTDSDGAVQAIEELLTGMTQEQKESPTGIDLATLYAETAAMRASAKETTGGSVLVDAATIADIEGDSILASEAAEAALENGGITTAREFSKTVVLKTDQADIDVSIDPDVLETQVDKVRIETPTYALTFKLEELREDLTDVLTFRAEDTNESADPTATEVKLSMPEGQLSNPITVSLPKVNQEVTYQAVVSAEDQATASKYNPACDLIDGKINTSGSYSVTTRDQDFSDIANRSQEMQKAIRYLASKGIINGTTETQFSPNGSINRAEIASLIVKALGKLDQTAKSSFIDTPESSWFYAAAASSQKQGYIQGYEDGTFRGATDISKIQIVSVAARVLAKEMQYKTPEEPAAHLAKYSDTVDAWAQPDVALATRENLVLYRKDGTFSGRRNMTRGDAAILIYRLFRRLW